MKKCFILMLLILGIGTLFSRHAEARYGHFGRHGAPLATDSVLATFADADSIFGNDFLGPQAIALAFGIDIDDVPMPVIPFSKDELIFYHDLGFMLILQLDSLNGKPLTMAVMDNTYEIRMTSTEHLIDKNGMTKTWPSFSKERFFTSEMPRFGWRLVTKDLIPESMEKNFVAQTDVVKSFISNKSIYYAQKVLIDTMTNKKMFVDAEDWSNYKKAATQFNSIGDSLIPLFAKHTRKYDNEFPTDTTGLQSAARMLAATQLSQSCRETAVEVFYRIIVYHAMTGHRLFEKTFVWTRSLAADNQLIGVGNFMSGNSKNSGMTIDKRYPQIGGPVRGTTFTRGKHFE